MHTVARETVPPRERHGRAKLVAPPERRMGSRRDSRARATAAARFEAGRRPQIGSHAPTRNLSFGCLVNVTRHFGAYYLNLPIEELGDLLLSAATSARQGDLRAHNGNGRFNVGVLLSFSHNGRNTPHRVQNATGGHTPYRVDLTTP